MIIWCIFVLWQGRMHSVLATIVSSPSIRNYIFVDEQKSAAFFFLCYLCYALRRCHSSKSTRAYVKNYRHKEIVEIINTQLDTHKKPKRVYSAEWCL